MDAARALENRAAKDFAEKLRVTRKKPGPMRIAQHDSEAQAIDREVESRMGVIPPVEEPKCARDILQFHHTLVQPHLASLIEAFGICR